MIADLEIFRAADDLVFLGARRNLANRKPIGVRMGFDLRISATTTDSSPASWRTIDSISMPAIVRRSASSPGFHGMTTKSASQLQETFMAV